MFQLRLLGRFSGFHFFVRSKLRPAHIAEKLLDSGKDKRLRFAPPHSKKQRLGAVLRVEKYQRQTLFFPA